MAKLPLNYRPEFLECRDYGHNWKVLSVQKISLKETRAYSRTMICERCSMQKVQHIASGVVIGNHYTQPEGYKIPDYHVGMKPALREVVLRRQIAAL